MEGTTGDVILRSAVETFTEYGYRKASVDKIATRARVAKGTVYLYCDSKEDLFYRAVHRELRDWVNDLSRLIDPRQPASQILVAMAQDHLAFLNRRPLARDLLCGVLDGQLPEWRARFHELRERGLQHVVEVLELGIRQGEFVADLDVEAVAQVLQDMQLTGALLEQRTELDADSVRRQQHAAVRLVLDGLRAR
jgi:TetR/AcrR family transcriptional regulator, cholesterol catabolism regulator